MRNLGSNFKRSQRSAGRAVAVIGLVMALAACGGSDEATDAAVSEPAGGSAPPSATARAGVDVAAANTPEEIGQAVADVYVQAFADLGEALADHPEEAVALERTREIHERHVRDLVTLGRKIEMLPAGDRATVESAVNQIQSKLQYDADIKLAYDAYRALHSHYREAGVMSSNREFNRLFASFNILTQYAFFDLLKGQNPEEAERLGL